MADRYCAIVSFPHDDHKIVDWALASTLIGGAYAWHVDMVEVNQYIACIGGLLGIALVSARLYFFLKEKWDERPKVDPRS